MNEFYQYVVSKAASGALDRATSAKLMTLHKQDLEDRNQERPLPEAYAIIGMASLFPGGEASFIENLTHKADCSKDLDARRKGLARDYCDAAGMEGMEFTQGSFLSGVDTFDYGFFRITARDAMMMDPCQRKFLEVAYHAFEDSGYADDSVRGSKTGVYVGYATFVQSNYGLMAYTVDNNLLAGGMVGNISALMPARISYFLDLKGPAVLLDTACSSSLVAVRMACEGIKHGDCDMALAAGVRVNLLPVENESLSLGVQSSDGLTWAFDDSADGTALSEGIGAVVIKKLSAAVRDNDRIYAVIKGCAVGHDGRSIGITAPNAESQTDVLTRAWDAAGVNPESLSFIQTHGTGTQLGDGIEIAAITQAFRQYTDKRHCCAISNVKSSVGHMFEASGMASLFAAVASLRERVIFPTAHFTHPNAKIDFVDSPVYMNTRLRPLTRSSQSMRCGVSSFGLSGTNCHIVLEEPPKRDFVSASNDSCLFTLSANTRQSLLRLAADYADFASDNAPPLSNLCYTAQTGSVHHSHRLAIVCDSIGGLRDGLTAFIKGSANRGVFSGSHKIVPTGKTDPAPGDITLERQRALSRQAAEAHNLADIAKLYVSGADVRFASWYPEKPTRLETPLYPYETEQLWFPMKEPGLYGLRWEPMASPPLKAARGSWHYVSIGASKLFKGGLAKAGKAINSIVGAYSAQVPGNVFIDVSGIAGSNLSAESVSRYYKRCESLYLLLASACSASPKPSVAIVGFEAYETREGDKPNPFQAAVLALADALRKDCPDLSVISADTDGSAASASALARLLDADYTGLPISIRGGAYYRRAFGEISPRRNLFAASSDGAYVVAGGVGGIGLAVASHLCDRGKPNLVLLSRRQIPRQNDWQSLLVSSSISRSDRAMLEGLISLKDKAQSLDVLQCDITDRSAVEDAMARVREMYGGVRGVIHSAGVSRDETILDRAKPSMFSEVVLPKLLGTANLHNATLGDNLECFLMFSSVATVFSALGQSDYILANAFLDEFALYRRSLGLTAQTINWCTWKETGMAHRAGFTVDTIFKAMTTDDAIAGFSKAFMCDAPRVVVGYLNRKGGYNLLAKSRVPVFGRLKADMEELTRSRLAKASETISAAPSGLILEGRNDGDYSELERVVASVFSEVLGFNTIDVFENFFELGMDSISGMKITGELSKRLDLDISVVDLLQNARVFDFCARIKDMRQPSRPAAEPTTNAPTRRCPLSPSQRGIYLLYKVQEKSTNYNVSNVSAEPMTFSEQAVRSAAFKLVKRHEALRASFHDETGKLYQIIHPATNDFPLDVEVAEMGESELERGIHSIYAAFLKPFDLSRLPLFRIKIINTPAGRSVVMYDIHHIVTDGVSNEIIFRDFMTFYNGEELPELTYSYSDYCVDCERRLESGEFAASEAYWLDKLKGPLPLIDLPTRQPRAAVQHFEGGHVVFSIDESRTSALKAFGAERGTTLYASLLSLLYAQLYKYSGQRDIIVGSPTIGRRDARLNDIVGMFVNTIALRQSVDDGLSFENFAHDVRQTVLDAFENQYYPFSELAEKLDVRRDLSRNPVFDVMLVLQNYGAAEGGELSLSAETVKLANQASKFDISLSAIECGGAIHCDIEYSAALFADSFIKRFSDNFLELLDEVLADPGKPLSALNAVSRSELSLIRGFAHRPAGKQGGDGFIARFDEAVDQFADRIAITHNGIHTTFAELGAKAETIARRLLAAGVIAEEPIAVVQKRGAPLFASIFGALKAGCAFVPLEPTLQAERLKFILNDCGCRFALVSGAIEAMPDNITRLDVSQPIGVPAVDRVELPKENSDSLAYIMYTSGSTGQPKGVMVERHSVAAFIDGFYDEMGSDERVMLQQYSHAFDGFNEEVYPALLSGSRIVVADKMDVLDPSRLRAIVDAEGVDSVSVSAALFPTVASCLSGRGVKLLISGGDVLKTEHVPQMPGTALYNSYGPTEACCCATYHKITGGEAGSLPIGRALAGYSLFILGAEGNPKPIGTVGEICVGGPALARGYLNRQEATDDSFVANAFAGGRIYKTGDLGRWLESGEIEFLGRADRQVKVRGYRVEAGEVESAVLKYPGVRDALVIPFDRDIGRELRCYFTAGDSVSPKEIRDFLRKSLPEYMTPACLTRLTEIPLTDNGKVDIGRLPAPDPSDMAASRYVAPRTQMEAVVSEVFGDVLGLPRVGVEDNFFDLGGNSIKAIEMLSLFIARGLAADINMIFENQDAASLAAALSQVGSSYMADRFEYIRAGLVEDNKRRAARFESDAEMSEKLRSYSETVDAFDVSSQTARASYNNILLVGATGYLGGFILNGLLQGGDAAIHLIVRAVSDEEAKLRVIKSMSFFFPPFSEQSLSRIRFYAGDASVERFGLANEVYERLASEIDCLINAAALVRHNGQYSEFEKANVFSVETCLKFAADGFPKPMHHVSTISVGSGYIEGKEYAVFTERDVDLGQVGDNNYVNSKIEAERVIEQARAAGASVTVYRVGNLVFRSSDGQFQRNIGQSAFYNLFKAVLSLGKVPDTLGVLVDFTYVDKAAEAILLLFDKQALQGGTYHLFNANPLELSEFADMIAACGRSIEAIPLGEFVDFIEHNAANPTLREPISAVVQGAGLLNVGQSTDFRVRQALTAKVLTSLGFEWRRMDFELTRKMLGYCVQAGFIEQNE